MAKTDEEIRGKSFVFSIIKNIIGDQETEKAIQKVVFTKDKKGLVFDISSEYDDIIQEKWFNTKSLEMKPLTELPEVEQEQSSGGGGYKGRNGGGGGGRFGNRGGNDRRGGGGGRFGNRGGNDRRGGGFGGGGDRSRNNDRFDNKRKFDSAAASSSNKRIKFD